MIKNSITKNDLEKILFHYDESRVLEVLEKNKRENAGNIADKARIDRSLASVALNKLYSLKIVNRERKGRYTEYWLDREVYEQYIETYSQIDIFEKEQIDLLINRIGTRQNEEIEAMKARRKSLLKR